MIIDTEKIHRVIMDDNLSSYRLSVETGVTRTILSKYRKGEIDLNNMRLSTLIKIQQWIDKN